MANTMLFGEVLEAADRLSTEEQQELVAILQRRLVQLGRQRLAAEMHEATQEFAEGRCRPATPDELVREIQE